MLARIFFRTERPRHGRSSRPGKVEIIDTMTVEAGEFIHLVNPYQTTPVTVFLEEGKLMAETPVYEPESRKADRVLAVEREREESNRPVAPVGREPLACL